jgi:hypothetical protein
MVSSAEVIDLFLAGGHVVATAVADEVVGEAWDRPSVLAEQTVGGVAGHLARGGVWVVGDYLDGGEPTGAVTFESAAEYFATLVSPMAEEGHRAIRARGAAVAAARQTEVVAAVSARLGALEQRLGKLPAGARISVASGIVMRLSDYLVTRIVEQTVHLDDLARSVGGGSSRGDGDDGGRSSRPRWSMPDAAVSLTIEVGAQIGRLGHGPVAVIRALYRTGFADSVLPVL